MVKKCVVINYRQSYISWLVSHSEANEPEFEPWAPFFVIFIFVLSFNFYLRFSLICGYVFSFFNNCILRVVKELMDVFLYFLLNINFIVILLSCVLDLCWFIIFVFIFALSSRVILLVLNLWWSFSVTGNGFSVFLVLSWLVYFNHFRLILFLSIKFTSGLCSWFHNWFFCWIFIFFIVSDSWFLLFCRLSSSRGITSWLLLIII